MNEQLPEHGPQIPAGTEQPLLQRLGAACGRRPLLVIAAWVAVLVVVVVASKTMGGIYSDSVNLSGTQSSLGLSLLKAHAPAASGYAGTVVIRDGRGAVQTESQAIGQAVAGLSGLDHVLSVSNPLSATNPRVSADGRIASITVHFDVLPKTLGSRYVGGLDRAVAPVRARGLQVEYGGSLDQLTRPKTSDLASEGIGFAVALVVLLVAFGSVAGAFLPLLTAVFSVLIGVSLLSLMAAVVSFGTASPTLALMIGLGVGIDYAVFSTTRFRQLIADGVEPPTAAGYTTATSGHAVLVAAATVTVAMLGLYASGITFIGQLGFAAVFGVVTAAAGAVTLVPAGLALLGRRIDGMKVRSHTVAESGRDDDGWHRYAAVVARHSWAFLLAGVVILGVLAVPLLSIRLGHVDDGADPHSYTDKRAYDLTTEGFGPGANGPFTVVVDVSRYAGSSSALAQDLRTRLQSTPGVARVSALSPSPDAKLLIGTVIPRTGPQSRATTSLFNRLIHTTVPEALRGTAAAGYVTGSLASNIRFAATITSRLPIIIAVVVATAFLLIMTTFRSLLLAVKAAVLNLLSIGAAYGVVVAVFQWGWGRSLIGVSENVPVESYVPMLMFAIVFGLSMDYEVFLLSRVQETWQRTADAHLAVARGLSQTARVITCAALIMVSVFTAFVGSTNVVVKMLAIGLAFSVLIDASVVRLLLVPAVMNLLGRSAWWIPGGLDRVLPHIEAEGAILPPDAGPVPAALQGAPTPVVRLGPGHPEVSGRTTPPPTGIVEHGSGRTPT